MQFEELNKLFLSDTCWCHNFICEFLKTSFKTFMKTKEQIHSTMDCRPLSLLQKKIWAGLYDTFVQKQTCLICGCRENMQQLWFQWRNNAGLPVRGPMRSERDVLVGKHAHASTHTHTQSADADSTGSTIHTQLTTCIHNKHHTQDKQTLTLCSKTCAHVFLELSQ